MDTDIHPCNAVRHKLRPKAAPNKEEFNVRVPTATTLASAKSKNKDR